MEPNHGITQYRYGCRCDICKKANATAGRNWRNQNPVLDQKHRKEFRFRQEQINLQIIEALKTNPCTDCGQVFPPECMDFDHTEDNKINDVSRLARRYSLKSMMDEIVKCELVCANCHRIRTKARRNANKE